MKKYLFLSKKLQFEREKSSRRCGARGKDRYAVLTALNEQEQRVLAHYAEPQGGNTTLVVG